MLSHEKHNPTITPEWLDVLENDISAHLPIAAILSVGPNPPSFRDILLVSDAAPQDARIVCHSELSRRVPETMPYINDDAVLFTMQAIRYGIAFESTKQFHSRLTALQQGRDVAPRFTNWSAGPWLPEALAADLHSAQTVKTNPETASHLAMFQQYPDKLRRAIMAYSMQEITEKLKHIANPEEPSLQEAYATLDIALAGLRFAHAQDAVYFRGLKYASQSVRSLSQPVQLFCEGLLRQDYSAPDIGAWVARASALSPTVLDKP